MIHVYTVLGSPLHAALCEAFLAHYGFVHVDGTWFELVTVAPTAQGFEWIGRRAFAGAA